MIVQTVEAHAVFDASKFKSGVNEAEQSAQSLTKGLGSVSNATDDVAKHTDGLSSKMSKGFPGFGDLLGSLSKVGMGVFGLKTLADGVGGVLGGMVAGNSEMEMYETQLGTLLGSSDAAKERLAELAEFGAKTPFELPEVVRADKVLTGFGFNAEKAFTLTGKNLGDFRTLVGDVAAGTGAKFEDIALTFGKFSAGATGEAISRFQEMGIATKEQMAGLGITFSKSGEMLSPLPDAMQAIVKIAGDKFGGGMDKLSQTFGGKMSNLADSFDQAKRKLMAPIFDKLQEGLGNLLTVIGGDDVQKGISGLGDLIANGLSKLGDIVGPVFTTVLKFVDMIKAGIAGDANSFFLALQSGAKNLGINIDGLEDKFTQVTNFFFGTLPQALDETGKKLKEIGDQIGPVADKLGGLLRKDATTYFSVELPADISKTQRSLGELSDAFRNAGSVYQAYLKTIGVTGALEKLEEVLDKNGVSASTVNINWVKLGIQGFMPGLGAVISLMDGINGLNDLLHMLHDVTVNVGIAFSGFGANVLNLKNNVQQTISDLWRSITDTWSKIEGNVRDTLTSMQNTADNVWHQIQSTIQDTMNNVRTFITDRWSDARNLVMTVQNQIRDTIRNIWNAIPEDIRQDLVLIYNTMSQRFADQVANVVSWMGTVKQSFVNAWNDIVATVGNIMSGLGTKANEAMSAVNSTINSWWGTITGTVGNIAQGMVDRIRSFISPIGNAGNDMLSTLNSTISNWWNTISGTANTIGHALIDGIAGAINESKGWLIGVASGLIDAINGVVGSWWQLVTNTAWSIGRAIIDGIWNGLQSGWDWLLQVAEGLARSILQRAKDVLHIGSPSLAFAEIGMNIMAGLQQGLAGGFPAVVGAVEGYSAQLPLVASGAGTSTNSTTNQSSSSVVFNFKDTTLDENQLRRALWRQEQRHARSL